jgi:hypothetical protein
VNGATVALPRTGVAGSRLGRLATSGLAWGFAVSAALVAWVVFDLGGWDYYGTPLEVRGYAPAQWLRPSGPVGQTLGVAGTVLMLVPFAYMARKRMRRLREAGSLKRWLEVHLFCGIVGPVMITLHTSLKFNGIISAAYWSMVIVVLSGFAGRYLYTKIPHSVRGNELTRTELNDQAAALQEELARAVQSEDALARIHMFERAAVPARPQDLTFGDLLFGEIRLGGRLRALDHELARAGLAPSLRHEAVRLTRERSVILRRAAYLDRTRKLFNLWHVFHLPLVYLMLVIVTAHIAVVLYLGYVPFRW